MDLNEHEKITNELLVLLIQNALLRTLKPGQTLNALHDSKEIAQIAVDTMARVGVLVGR
jgi:hypothetical protein